MTRIELLEIINNGESSRVEFKRDTVRPEQLAKEIVALANLQGGILMLGVEDDGVISGISRADLETWIMDTVFGRYVHPLILPCYEEIQLDDGKRVAIVSFPQGISKPYVLRHNDREDVYIRVGSVSRLATREQQAQLYSTGGLLHSELMPVSGTSLQSLDTARLENYIRDILRDPEMPINEADWENRLLGLGFMVPGVSGQTLCSIAGLLLFGIKPRRYLKQAGLRLMVFPGVEKEYQALLDEVLDAPLVGRWGLIKNEQNLIDSGLIEQFASRITPYISSEATDIDQYMRREKNWLYPFAAIRETVINSFAHRDWTRFVDIDVCLYADRLEVNSPGALPNSMTIEKMIAGQRSPRNPIIMEVLRDYGYVDARGMGVRTKVIPLMRAIGIEPLFEATEDYLKTVLGQLKGQTTKSGASLILRKEPEQTFFTPLTDFQRELLHCIEATPSVQYVQMAAQTDKDISTVRRNIQKLKQMGFISRTGSKKVGCWEILRKSS